MVEIIPAIMPDSLDDFREKAELISGLAPFAQVDVMDGKFVPSRSWPYFEGDQKEFDALAHEEQGLPQWESLNYEVDLMVEKPEEQVSGWISAGARRIVTHIESTTDVKKVIDSIRGRSGEKGSEWGVEIGLSLYTTNDIAKLDPYITDIDFVQCMGIERIGYQGESFDERGLKQVQALRAKYPELALSIDGSVNMETARRFIDAGANRLVVGSALFTAPDINEAMQELKEVVHV